jgi:hypothetical protein
MSWLIDFSPNRSTRKGRKAARLRKNTIAHGYEPGVEEEENHLEMVEFHEELKQDEFKRQLARQAQERRLLSYKLFLQGRVDESKQLLKL